LTEADGIWVASAVVSPDELAPGTNVVSLGDVTITSGTPPGLAGDQGSPSLAGLVEVTVLEGDETAIRKARRQAAELMGLVKATIAADPTVDNTIQPPGGTRVAISALSETPVDWKGQAARRATYPFTVSWSSHVA